MKKTSFYSWLLQQKKRQDPIGDLASDVKADDTFPENMSTIEEGVEYLENKTMAIPEAVEAMKQAWNEYTETGGEVGNG